ncbi:MAG: cation diffusion facilitator family transporter [Tannerellaceae bacterium]|jgi:cation diffusion facilitator family transporter|nr:cation diffusion facilitator family transporter [Tannerellaceae bacterium]
MKKNDNRAGSLPSKEKILKRTSWISTAGNTILSASKIIAGIMSGSMAVLSDGIDSATDVIISVVMVFTAGIISRPPSSKYVYGYEKAESIATKILSLVIFYAGIQMLITSAGKVFFAGEREMPEPVAIYVTVLSIFGKLGLAFYQYREGRRIKSSMLIANAKNMSNDVIISLSVLLGLMFTFFLRLPVLDCVTGLVVSLFIIRSSIAIFMDSNVELMDGVKDITIYNKIFEAVDKVPGASNPHRVRSRLIGNLYMIDLDVEADGSISLSEAHSIADAVERSIKDSIENVYDIVVHIEPRGKHHNAEKFGIDRNMIK